MRQSDMVGGGGQRLPRTDLMLLGLLASRSMHGYEIADYLSQPKMTAWVKLGRTSIYYALGRLEKQGLVSKHSERHGGKPERTVYSITETGRETFISSLEDAIGSGEGVTDEFDIALYFSTRLDALRTQDRIQARLSQLEEQAARLSEISQLVTPEQDGDLMLVLEHRLAVLRADIDFLLGFIHMLHSGSARVGQMAGSLGETSLSEVLLNLQAAGRSGLFRVRTSEGETTFAFDDGRLYGVVPASGMTLEESLRLALTSYRGTYEFDPSDVIEADAVPVEGLVQAILRGTRGLSGSALTQMAPMGDTLLDTRAGYEREIIGIDLSDDERRLLAELDGVRTFGELGRALGCSSEEVRRVAYPLWLVGWVIRTDRSKRSLILAMFRYVGRWEEAIRVFAGEEGVRRVFEDVDLAAQGAGLMAFRDVASRIESTRFSRSANEVAMQAREYAELLERAVSARLGDGFSEDVSTGYARQLNQEDVQVLEAFGVVS